MYIHSINRASKTTLTAGGIEYETGICKQPCDQPVAIGSQGLAGDTIVDRSVHGGEDQAVYLYSLADYQWWSEQLGRPVPPGIFGENLTLSAFPEQPLKIGDRLTINDQVELEITAPRVPCVKLATRMGDPTFAKKFVAAVRPGAYARVLRTGTVAMGDPVQWQPTTEDFVLVNDVFVEWHKKDWSAAVFEKALQSPIARISRAIIKERFLKITDS